MLFFRLFLAVCTLVNFHCVKVLQQYQRGIKTRAVFCVFCALLGRYLFRACQETLLDALLPGACQWAAPYLHGADFPLPPMLKFTLCSSSHQSCHNFSCIPSVSGTFSCHRLSSHIFYPYSGETDVSLFKIRSQALS